MGLWEKVKTGTKGFIKSVIHYLPRGLMIAGAIFGGSYLLGSMGLWDPLNVVQNLASNPGAIVTHIATSMAIGSLISGGIGAYQNIAQESEAHHRQEAAARGESRLRLRGQVRDREQSAEITADTAAHTLIPHHGLPMEVVKSVATQAPGV